MRMRFLDRGDRRSDGRYLASEEGRLDRQQTRLSGCRGPARRRINQSGARYRTTWRWRLRVGTRPRVLQFPRQFPSHIPRRTFSRCGICRSMGLRRSTFLSVSPTCNALRRSRSILGTPLVMLDLGTGGPGLATHLGMQRAPLERIPFE